MKRWFQARKPREQALLAAFTLLGAVTWLSAAHGRWRGRRDDWRASRADLAAQQLWLDQQRVITDQSAAAVRNLDPARTYDSTRLVTDIMALAAKAGLAPVVDTPVTRRATRFTYHQARVSFPQATLPALLQFSDEIARLAPYLSLEQLTVQVDRASADTLNVTLLVSATQIGEAAP